MLTDFNILSVRLSSKFAIVIMKRSTHRHCVATLLVKSPCSKIVMLNDWVE